MRHCAFLTLENQDGFVIDDELAYEPLRKLGWRVEEVPWRKGDVSWDTFDAVIIRSPWDYQDDPDAFLEVLEEIDRSDTLLLNELDMVRWNLRKTYLRDLEERGVPTVPTLWRDALGRGELSELFDELGAAEMMVKPVVGANADGAFRLNAENLKSKAQTVEAYYAERPLMAQPFTPHVLDEGEFSLFYFNGAYSHSVLKKPKKGDFRVQEEHGGSIHPVEIDDKLRRAGEQTMRALNQSPLYARADFLRTNDGSGYWLIELELIEPCLYFRIDPDSPMRFARALGARMREPRRC